MTRLLHRFVLAFERWLRELEHPQVLTAPPGRTIPQETPTSLTPHNPLRPAWLKRCGNPNPHPPHNHRPPGHTDLRHCRGGDDAR